MKIHISYPRSFIELTFPHKGKVIHLFGMGNSSNANSQYSFPTKLGIFKNIYDVLNKKC